MPSYYDTVHPCCGSSSLYTEQLLQSPAAGEAPRKAVVMQMAQIEVTLAESNYDS